MMTEKRKGRRVSILISLALVTLMTCGGLFTGCGSDENALDLKAEGTRIACDADTPFVEEIPEKYPNAELVLVNSFNEGVMALRADQADAYVGDGITMQLMIDSDDDSDVEIKENFGDPIGVVAYLQDGGDSPVTQEVFQQFLAQEKSNGVLDDMLNRWVDEHDYEMPDFKEIEHPKGTLKVATTGLLEPYTFIGEDSELMGMDVELARRLAAYMEYDIEFVITDWTGVRDAVGTGKADCAISNLYPVGEEGNGTVFSESYYSVQPVVAGCSGTVVADYNGLFTDLKDRLRKCLVVEDRWKTIAKGLLMTAEITLLAILLGTVLGFAVCMGKRSRYRWLSETLNTVTSLLEGIPVLVLLMMMYYIVFVDSSALLVASLAFAINFGAFTSDSMKTAIDGIRKEQWESGAALGLEKGQIFRKIVVPQALQIFMPGYTGQMVALMQQTSIVGYVSVIDITYAAQIIRGRTYDAVIPLLISAAIYLILSVLLTRGVKALCGYFFTDKKRLKDIDLTWDRNAGVPTVEHRDEPETLIEIKGLVKSYPGVTPLKDLDCEVRAGEIISVIGPSGTGKSTLLRLINRMEDVTEGSVKVFGQEITTADPKQLSALRRRLGMVFQSYSLFEHLNIAENIMLAPVTVGGKTRQEAYEEAMELLNAVGLADKAMSMPSELSGGQKQRVAIVRAMAMHPEVLLCDEPTSALDPKLISEVLIVMKALANTGVTMVIATHEMKFAREISTRIFYMDQGIVYETGSPEQIFEHPQTDRCRVFIRKLKMLELQLKRDGFDLPAEMAKVSNYAWKYRISGTQFTKLQQILEELCLIKLMPLAEDQTVNMNVEYDEENESCTADVTWSGPAMDPLADTDDIGVRLLTAHLRSAAHTWNEETGINRIRFEL